MAGGKLKKRKGVNGTGGSPKRKKPEVEDVENVPDIEETAASDMEEEEGDFLEDDSDVGEDGEQGQDVGQKGPPSKHQQAFKAPTTEEIRHLSETESLFKSNLFRLQIEELLKEVRVNYAKQSKVNEALLQIKSALEGLPDKKVSSDKYTVPLRPELLAEEVFFQFKSPETVEVVGSYLTQTVCRPQLVVDVAMMIPDACLLDKDFLDFRYFKKRALYLAVVAKELSKSWDVEIECFQNDIDKPVLILKQKDNGGKKKRQFTYRLLPWISKSVFAVSKLAPSRNNLRELGSNSDGVSSPYYNNRVAEDMCLFDHGQQLAQLAQSADGLKDAILLTKVWLRQRGLDGPGFLPPASASMLFVHLMSTRRVNRHMSSYQLFHVALEFIANSDLSQSAWVSGDASVGLAFQSNFKLAFVDKEGIYNFAGRVLVANFKELQRQASITCSLLKSTDQSSEWFAKTFMTKWDFVGTFDHYVRLTAGAIKEGGSQAQDYVTGRCDQVLSVLERGYGERVTSMGAKIDALPRWKFSQGLPMDDISEVRLFFGLLVDQEKGTKLVDMGPSADDQDAAEDWKRFWGEKSELRRFKDGAIVEAVVWDHLKAPSQKPLILREIAKHLLNRHCDVAPDDMTYIANQFDWAISRKGALASVDTGTLAVKTFDELCKHMKALEDLPLEILSILGDSPGLRHTSTLPPVPMALAGQLLDFPDSNNIGEGDDRSLCVTPLKAVVKFESSGKWPDDLEAIARIKSAFYIKIAQSIQKNVEHADASPNANFTEVMYGGFIYHLRIFHDREIALWRAKLKGKPLNAFTMREDPKKDEMTEVEKNDMQGPIVASTLHNFHLKYPAYGPTARIAKRWLHSHMFSGHFDEILIDLAVASLFQHEPRPGSGIAGFLRFLHFLSTFSFHERPLIVDVEGVLKAKDIEEINAHFEETRTRGGPPIYLSTPQDKFSRAWSKASPSAKILQRLVVFATNAFQTVKSGLVNFTSDAQWKTIFVTPLRDYDAIINLDPTCVPAAADSVEYSVKGIKRPKKSKFALPKYKNLQSRDQLMVDFDPIKMLVHSLEARFSDIALFFHDAMGGSHIAIVWKPAAFLPRKLRIVNSTMSLPIAHEGKLEGFVTPNIFEILSDMETIGEGLIVNIEHTSGSWRL